jgi:hypothetical protein
MVTLLGVISGFFMKLGLMFSAIKFKLALMTANIPAIISHYKFSEGLSIGARVMGKLPI